MKINEIISESMLLADADNNDSETKKDNVVDFLNSLDNHPILKEVEISKDESHENILLVKHNNPTEANINQILTAIKDILKSKNPSIVFYNSVNYNYGFATGGKKLYYYIVGNENNLKSKEYVAKIIKDINSNNEHDLISKFGDTYNSAESWIDSMMTSS